MKTIPILNFAPFKSYKCKLALMWCFVSHFMLMAQQKEYAPKTPEANSMTKYGEYSVGLFTGRPNISVPISVSEEVPISLSYNAGGHKPEEHHGWVGLGWNLNVGGMVTRVKRGLHDEFKFDYTPIFKPSYMDNNWRMQGVHGTWDDNILDLVASQHTNDSQDSVRFRTQRADFEPDEFYFNFGNYSGSFLLNHEGKWIFRGNNPNDFRINVTTENDFSLVPTISNMINIPRLPRIITRITITAPDGTAYIFGDDINAIDLTYDFVNSDPLHYTESMYASTWHLVRIMETNGKVTKFTYEKNGFNFVINRNKILSKARGFIKKGVLTNAGLNADAPDDIKIGTMLFNSYLTKIETPYEVIKFEKEALSGYLDYGDLDKALPSGVAQYTDINTKFQTNIHSSSSNRKWFKLNAIKTYSKVNFVETTNLLNQVNFEYNPPVTAPTTTNPKRRLRLNAVKQINVVDNSSITVARFDYNPTFLPDYNTAQIDHWGYFNGKNLSINVANSFLDQPDFVSQYNNFRVPDETLTQAEMLQKIHYPTGGYTQFDFEQHDFRTAVKRERTATTTQPNTRNQPFDIKNDYTTNQPAGGVRIRRIINNDKTKSHTKEYFYTKDFSPETNIFISTGVLDGLPNYFDVCACSTQTPLQITGTAGAVLNLTDYVYMNEQSLTPLNLTEGSPVAYSEVVEKLGDNSYTIYKFTNSDEGIYRSRTALDFKEQKNTGFVNKLKDPIIDIGQLRGRLKEQQIYNSTGQILKKVANDYAVTLNADNAVRAITALRGGTFFFTSTSTLGLDINDNGERVAGSTYTYLFSDGRVNSYLVHIDPNLLSQSITTDYFYQPNVVAAKEMVTTTTYAYDSYLNVRDVVTTSSDTKSNVTTSYRYAYDNATEVPESAEAGSWKADLVAFHMIGIPVVTKNSFNKGSKVEYKRRNINFTLP